MKNRKLIIFLIVILSILIIISSIGYVVLIKNNFKFNLGSSKELVIDKTYNQVFDSININSTISEIYIKKSNDNNIKTIIYGDKDYIDVNTDNGKLNIKINEKNCIGFCFNIKSNKIEIYLPEDYDKKIDIKNDYGDIFVEEFSTTNIDIKEEVGDIKILSGNNINIKSNYGDIEIEKGNKTNIDIDCGDTKISNINDINIKSSYGDIKIKKINNYFNIENDCGDVEIDNINIKNNSYIKNDYGDIEINNTNQIFIDAYADYGDIKIKNNYNKSDVVLKIENDCGDIIVNN